MLIPGRPHYAAGQVELDVVDAVLHLLADRPHKAIWAVALARLAGCEEVAAGGRQEIAACEYAGACELAAVKGAFPRYVHKIRRAAAAHGGYAALSQRLRQRIAEVGHLLGGRYAGRRRVFGVDVNIPQAGQQIRAVKVYHARAACLRGMAAVQHFGDAPVLYDDAGVGNRRGVDAVNHIGVGEN